MSPNKCRWTHNQTKKLRELTNKSTPIGEICKKLGKSHDAIISKQNRLGIYQKTRNVKYYTEQEIMEILYLISLGLSDREIATKVNRNITVINKLVKKLKNGYVHPAIWSSSEIELLKQLVVNNAPWNELTSRLHRSNGEITRKRRELGLFRKRKHATEFKKIDDATLKMLRQGSKIEEIALSLNRGSSFILQRCKCLGLTNEFSQLRGVSIPADEAYLEDRFNATLISIKSRSKKMNKPFSLTIHKLISLWKEQRGKCFYSNSDLTLDKGKDNTFSVDRIDPSKGYVIDNVCLCRYDINWMKMDKTVEEFVNLLKQIYEFQLSK